MRDRLRPPRPACPCAPLAAGALYELLQDCWQHEPQKRPAFTEVVARLGALQHIVPTQAFPWALGEKL